MEVARSLRKTIEHTTVIASAHTVTFDAGLAGPFFAIDVHAGVNTAECGRRRRLAAAFLSREPDGQARSAKRLNVKQHGQRVLDQIMVQEEVKM
jgi:hypothetical protein